MGGKRNALLLLLARRSSLLLLSARRNPLLPLSALMTPPVGSVTAALLSACIPTRWVHRGAWDSGGTAAVESRWRPAASTRAYFVQMSASQAAGEIVEFAIQRNIPFALVSPAGQFVCGGSTRHPCSPDSVSCPASASVPPQASHRLHPLHSVTSHCARHWQQVPCCVYRKEFPKRRIPDGDSDGSRPVRTYEDLLVWLSLKHPRVRRQQLDFEGRNTVLFTLPEDMDGLPSPA